MPKVVLNFTNTVTGNDALQVWRATVPDGIGALYDTIAPTAQTYTDANPPVGTVYYQIKATKVGVAGPMSSWGQIAVPAMLGTITALTASVIP